VPEIKHLEIMVKYKKNSSEAKGGESLMGEKQIWY